MYLIYFDGKCYFYFLKRSIFVRFVASKNSQLLGYFHFFASNVPRGRAHTEQGGRGHGRYGGCCCIEGGALSQYIRKVLYTQGGV